MGRPEWRIGIAALVAALALGACQDGLTPPETGEPSFAKGGFPGRPPAVGEESAGANLSFPTIWAEGVTKSPRGTIGVETLQGEWWWWWGEALVEGGDPLACYPDANDPAFCDDGLPLTTGPAPGAGAVKVYVQRDAYNEWQADNASGVAAPVVVDWIDWGDALEAVPWTIKSKVRVETTLFEDVAASMTGYTMRHVFGHGIDEMWAVETLSGAAVTYENLQAIVFSPCARLTIQKLAVPREELVPLDPRLTWDAAEHAWTETDPAASGDLVNDVPVFNGPLAPEGPAAGFGAEINIQGKIVYGFTWDVKTMNDGVGSYRLTFSLADDNCAAALNTYIDATTQIVVPEEEVVIAAEPIGGGGRAVVDPVHNLTYIDILIELKATGNGGGGGGGGGNGGGGGGGGNGPGGPGQ